MSAVYTRRVSFDSLNPNIHVEPDEPIHIPPQYLNKVKNNNNSLTNKRGLDLNFGYEPSNSKNQDLFKVFDSFQEINNKINHKNGSNNGNYQLHRRKFPKLPPPPTKSILKKNNQYDNNIDNNYSIDDSIPKTMNDETLATVASNVLPSQQRKKSIVEMSPEELLAMDKQFKTAGVSIDKFEFDGDNYLPSFSNATNIDSLKRTNKSNLSNVDKLVGNIVTVNNRKLLKSNSVNFKSYSISFRHRLMSNYIVDYFAKINKNNNENNDSSSDNLSPTDIKKNNNTNNKSKKIGLKNQCPESLRDLIVYISGRKHTWDSINWVLKNFLIDGDHLIIISQLPTSKSNEFGSPMKDQFGNYIYDDDEEFESELIKEKAEALSSYIFKAIELLKKQDLKISITVEFIKDSSVKNLIKNSVNLYNPNFFLISSLISNRLTIKFDNNNVKLPYYLMKNLNLSTIIIPDLLIDKETISLNDNNSGDTTPIPNINIEYSNPNPFGNNNKVENEVEDQDEDIYLNNLNKISDIYKSAQDQHHFQVQIDDDSFSRSNSNTNSNSNSRTNSTADDEADQPANYYPKIKFSENLSIPRYNSNNSGNSLSPSISSSPYSSRRNSNNSSGIYKVKSLLDEHDPIPKERSKSMSTPTTNERRHSSTSVRKSKSIDEGDTPKKSGFLSKFGFKKK